MNKTHRREGASPREMHSYKEGGHFHACHCDLDLSGEAISAGEVSIWGQVGHLTPTVRGSPTGAYLWESLFRLDKKANSDIIGVLTSCHSSVA